MKTGYRIGIVILMIGICALGVASYFLFFKSNCSYGTTAREGESVCTYSVTDCKGYNCTGISGEIACGESRDFCGEQILCQCR